MNKNEFFKLFKDEMDMDDNYNLSDISEYTPLSDFDNWDSLSRALVYNFVQRELGVKMNQADLRACTTIGDLCLLLKLDE